MYSVINAAGLHGMECYPARVEVDISRGLPGFEMVGLLSGEIKEARERIRVALRNAEITLPPVRITVNISPASVHKEGTFFDLPVAAGILVSLGMLPQEYTEDVLVLGELGLNGDVKPVKGVLPVLLKISEMGMKRCILPSGNMPEAELAGVNTAVGINHLTELFEALGGSGLSGWNIDKQADVSGKTLVDKREVPDFVMGHGAPDFSGIMGQETVKRAAMTAAAGFHHLMMIGPPGSGKTMTARCMPSILPPLTDAERLEVLTVYSVTGELDEVRGYTRERPFVSPHHTVSAAALTGGGAVPRPGLISLAHKGVLFLDELTEYRRSVLDLLRQPMEEHRIRISRCSANYNFPADFILLASMNPCPCGYFPDRNRCRCTPHEIRQYLNRISGPIMDRIDICTEVPAVDISELMGCGCGKKRRKEYTQTDASDSRRMRAKVMHARLLQERRYEGRGFLYNSQLSPEDIREFCPLGAMESRFAEQLFQSMNLSARAYHRIVRVARTLADLDDSPVIEKVHISEAVCCRSSLNNYWKV